MPFPHEAILGLDFFSALVDAFLQITRGLRPLVILGNASTCAEKKSNPRIASWGKDTHCTMLVLITKMAEKHTRMIYKWLQTTY